MGNISGREHKIYCLYKEEAMLQQEIPQPLHKPL